MQNLPSQIQFNNNYIPRALRSETLTQDDRIDLFFTHYFDLKNPETKFKIFPAALKAGFSSEEAAQIVNRNWFLTGSSEFRRQAQNDKADRNLDELLDIDFNVPIVNKTTGDVIGEGIDAAALQAKLKATLFVKERLDKDNFSQRIDKTETHNVNIFKTLQMIESGEYEKRLNDPAKIIELESK